MTEHDPCECRACYAQKMGLTEEAIDNWETEEEES